MSVAVPVLLLRQPPLSHDPTIMLNPPLRYAPNVESPPPDEPQDIERVLAALSELLRRDEALSGRKRRDVHVKSHGCPVAEFQVLPRLAPELRQGLFQNEARYEAAVRFSSASPWPKPDAVPDARGVAVKVRGISGTFLPSAAADSPAQDFVMANSPAFVSRDVKDYLSLQQARLDLLRRPSSVLKAFTSHSWNPADWHWKGLLRAGGVFTRFPAHPARLTYYSMVPIRFGDYIAKYRLTATRTASLPRLHMLLATRGDSFRLMLAETLRKSPLNFEFQVQLRTDSQSMPVEDAAIEWPQSESPYRTVAHLIVPMQELSASPFGTGDELAFNVWNALEAHRPLGGINRVRCAAYQQSAAWRLGQAAPQEARFP